MTGKKKYDSSQLLYFLPVLYPSLISQNRDKADPKDSLCYGRCMVG